MALPQDVGGIIHLAQLPPFKPHSVAPLIPRGAAGVASDTKTVHPPEKAGGPWASGEDLGGGAPGLFGAQGGRAVSSAQGTLPPLHT